MNEKIFLVELMDFFGGVSTIASIITIVFLFALSFKSLFEIKKRSLKCLEKNKNNKKYISKVYVEMDDYSEKLRYFSNYSLMINEAYLKYKVLISDLHFKEFMNRNNIKRRRKKYILLGISEIIEAYEKKYNSNTFECFAKFECESLIEELRKLKELIEFSKEKIVLVKGNAGTGKTNLICDFVYGLSTNKKSFAYIDYKNINDFDETIRLLLCGKKSNGILIFLLHLIFFVRKIFHIPFYFVIDGINENNNKEIDEKLCDFIKSNNNKSFKFVLSLREEYYLANFCDVLNKYEIVYKSIDIKNPNFLADDYKVLIKKYKEYFRFNGTINNATYKVITKNLLMTRIFFETFSNENSYKNIYQMNQIFDKYIKKLSNNYSSLSLVLTKLCNEMINIQKYDSIELTKILSDKIDENVINQLCMDSILISIDSYKNYLNPSVKNIYFNFDEFRDYVLAKTICEKIDSIQILEEMGLKKSVCFFGVFRYMYFFYKSNDNYKCISKMISMVESIDENRYYCTTELPFVLDVILSSESRLYDCEFEYIKNHNRYQWWNIIKKISENEILNISPKLYELIDCYKQNIEISINEFVMFDSKQLRNIYTNIKNKKSKKFLKLCIANVKNRSHNFNQDEYYREASYILIYKYKYLLIYGTKLKLKEMRKRFKTKKRGYFPELLKRVYAYWFWGGWSLISEYKKIYKKYFLSFEDFVLQKYRIMDDLNLKKIKMKFYFTNSDNSVYNILTYPTTFEIFKDFYEEANR